MQHCYNRGCGQTFDPEQNTDDACLHHPGEPFFHDAYKGWSCCNKKSVDFTEFLNIKGCTRSKHSNVKPPEPEKPLKDMNDENNEVVEVRAPIRPAMQRPPVDTPLVQIQAVVAPTLKEAIDKRKTQTSATLESNNIGPGGIAVGTTCKNAGCQYTYAGTAQDDCECIYHPGVPIFHEGNKYWSCCKKKTTDFSEFMSQKGCCYGQHTWVKENKNKSAVQCRYDWHQTPTNVIVSIYAKLYNYVESVVEVNPVRLHVNLVFPEQENANFDLDLELRGIIDVNKTTAHMYPTKVEIIMPKAEPSSWSKLDFPQDKLPPAQKTALSETKTKRQLSHDSEDGFNLDDIESVEPVVRLADITSTYEDENDVD